MKIDVFDESSRSQKEVISVLYRLILICYSIFLLVVYDFHIPLIYTILYFFVFATIFYSLFGKGKLFSLIRLINDYFFIGLTIWSINVLDIYTYSLIFLPILNSQNHTGNRKSFLLYLLPLALIFFIKQKFEFLIGVIFLAFYIINSFEKIKNKYQLFYNELNSVLDNFLVQENALDKIHNIYELIIPIFNKYSFFTKDIEDIICFQISQNKINVVNGSKFIYEIDFSSNDLILKNQKSILYNIELVLNGETVQENILLIIKENLIDYVYLIIPKSNTNLVLARNSFFYRLLFPFFMRMSHIFNFKDIQKIDQRKNFYNIAKKVTYVNNAINSMHFTRNKLSPLKNYLSMIDDYEKSKSEERKDMIEPFLKDERRKLKTSLNLILNRADIILEKSNNPFNVLESKEYSLITVLVKIREQSSFYLNSLHFDFNFKNFDLESEEKVKINETGIDLVLSNWFSNVSKYKADNTYGVTVDQDKDSFILTFFNSLTIWNAKNIPDFVVDFNSDDRMAILKRNTHGLVEIKDFLEQMGLEGKMKVKEEILFFEIRFLKLTYENIDI